MRPLYELSVEGCDPVVVTAEALFEAWAESAPDGVARACNLQLGQHVTVCEVPRVVVQRIR